jgi:hypothetical protein
MLANERVLAMILMRLWRALRSQPDTRQPGEQRI